MFWPFQTTTWRFAGFSWAIIWTKDSRSPRVERWCLASLTPVWKSWLESSTDITRQISEKEGQIQCLRETLLNVQRLRRGHWWYLVNVSSRSGLISTRSIGNYIYRFAFRSSDLSNQGTSGGMKGHTSTLSWLQNALRVECGYCSRIKFRRLVGLFQS
jgi:hypothetical protein